MFDYLNNLVVMGVNNCAMMGPSKFYFQAFRNEFANKNETILHFGNMKNLSDGCK
jgi:hypothetical protein